jgi:hypothetical protein
MRMPFQYTATLLSVLIYVSHAPAHSACKDAIISTKYLKWMVSHRNILEDSKGKQINLFDRNITWFYDNKNAILTQFINNSKKINILAKEIKSNNINEYTIRYSMPVHSKWVNINALLMAFKSKKSKNNINNIINKRIDGTIDLIKIGRVAENRSMVIFDVKYPNKDKACNQGDLTIEDINKTMRFINLIFLKIFSNLEKCCPLE